jgi:hypothetical protein
MCHRGENCGCGVPKASGWVARLERTLLHVIRVNESKRLHALKGATQHAVTLVAPKRSPFHCARPTVTLGRYLARCATRGAQYVVYGLDVWLTLRANCRGRAGAPGPLGHSISPGLEPDRVCNFRVIARHARHLCPGRAARAASSPSFNVFAVPHALSGVPRNRQATGVAKPG